MRFYIATRLERAADHNVVRDALIAAGHEITYDWTTHGSVKGTDEATIRRVCEAERDGVSSADFVVVLLPGGRGTHAELGMACAWRKPTYIHSVDPRPFSVREETCAFYWNSAASHFMQPTVEEFAQCVCAALAPDVVWHHRGQLGQ